MNVKAWDSSGGGLPSMTHHVAQRTCGGGDCANKILVAAHSTPMMRRGNEKIIPTSGFKPFSLTSR